ncbi:dodecin [Glaciibacter sp. 2TAF33]|jgi:flavin-binding protein dodecin|uniref:dodecin n=1 Tax=Glaciibacter sp. 2TAF33 TaxID=3233015 RepID=UPI003F928398
MSDTYRVVEVVGTSTESVTEAIKSGVERASRTLRQLDWFEVGQVRGQIENGTVAHYQVSMKIGFKLEE